MKYLRWLLLLIVFGLVATIAWWILSPPSPPEVEFGKVIRETLISELSTNGRTEPVEWSPVHVPREGRVAELFVERGSEVPAGRPLLRLDSPEAEADLASARARVARAQAALSAAERGGLPAEIAELDGVIARLRADRDAAARDETALERLLAKDAATRAERDAARDRRIRLDADLAAMERKRQVLADPAERTSARATLEEAQRLLSALETRIEQATVRSPRAGVVYECKAKRGDWLVPGEAAFLVGNLDRLRVAVFVDEPELGGLRLQLPVTITWDALPNESWKGTVERLPAQIVALGARQVGEVGTVLDNPDRRLPAGANVNARIRLQVVEGALSIPKEALRREGDAYGVFVLNGSQLSWRKVRTGAASVARLQILEGINEGDLVALGGEQNLRDGQDVRPLQPR